MLEIYRTTSQRFKENLRKGGKISHDKTASALSSNSNRLVTE